MFKKVSSHKLRVPALRALDYSSEMAIRGSALRDARRASKAKLVNRRSSIVSREKSSLP